MTQTIRTPNGKNGLWIEADFGQGRARLIQWHSVSLAAYVNWLDLEGLDEEQVEKIKVDLMKFTHNGKAWVVNDNGVSKIFTYFKDARDWAYSQNC